MPAATYDIKSENFDTYFVNEMDKLTPSQRLSLPASLLKQYRGTGKLDLYVARRLSFAQKAQLIMHYCGRRIFVFVDSENGLDADKFAAYIAEKKNWRKEVSEKEIVKGEAHFDFVLGQKELIDGMEYLSMIFRSPLYNYLKRPKLKTGKSGVTTYDIEREHFSKLSEALYEYESNKTYFLKAANLNVSMWYVLLYYGDDKLKKPPQKIVGATGSTQKSIQDAVYFLLNSGYLRRAGDSKAYYQITPYGFELLYKILSKDVVGV